MKFYSAYALLLTTALTMSILAIQVCATHAELTVLVQYLFVGLLWNFVLLGMGVGFMILLIATLFSWVQLYLLITGNIDPHLIESGFFKSIETFLNQLFVK